MFHLIGVNHNAQRHSPGAVLDADQMELQRCLELAIKAHHPSLIAVEESEDTLLNKKSGEADESIPRKVALTHGIKPLFCEPTDEEKYRAGYKSKSQIHLELSIAGLLNNVPSGLQGVAAHAVEMAVTFPIREECWITKLKEYLGSEVVLVLGEDHIESFGRRLRAQGVESKVICSGIGVSTAQRMEVEAARKFPIENPKLFSAMIQHVGSGD